MERLFAQQVWIVAVNTRAPDHPAAAVLAEELLCNWQPFGLAGRAGGHGEHQHFGAGREQRVHVAIENFVDVRAMLVVRPHRNALTKIGDGADFAEAMVAAKIAVLTALYFVGERLPLNGARAV